MNIKKTALLFLRDMELEIEEAGNFQAGDYKQASRIDNIKKLDSSDIHFMDSLIYAGVRGYRLAAIDVMYHQLNAGETLDQVLRFNQQCAFAYITGYNMYYKYTSDLYQAAMQCGKSSSMMNLYKAEMNNADRYLRSIADLVGTKKVSKSELMEGLSQDEF